LLPELAGGHMPGRRCTLMENTRKYESVFIVNATLEDEAIDEVVARFQKLVEENGTLESIDKWGKRKLAYPIDDMNEGYYVVMTFTAPAEFPAELDRIYNITDSVIRSIIVSKNS
jgi:small subunit ribosomal protein S6